MSFSVKNPFILRGPKKDFIHRMQRSESSLNSISSDSLSDSPITSPSPGSSVQSLSLISFGNKDSSRMPVSDSPSDQSPDMGVNSLTSPTMAQKPVFPTIPDQVKSSPDQSCTSSTHKGVSSASTQDSMFTITELNCSPSSLPSTFDVSMLPSPSEFCATPDTVSERLFAPFTVENSFDAQFQPVSNRRHSLSPKKDLMGYHPKQRLVSPDGRSTTNTSPSFRNERGISQGNIMCSFVSSGPGNITKRRHSSEEVHLCQVCEDIAAGFHCGAYVCEACKKFFVRCLKQDATKNFICSRHQSCVITKETRTQCQFCRFHKCVSLGMYKPGTWPGGDLNAEISNIPCKVCGASSSGYHFGAITCEGCKGFFRRTVKERDGIKYSCNTNGNCKITTATRNTCKFCRYQKCLQVGMTPSGSRIGRQPNAVKHKTMLELQQLHSEGGLLPTKDIVIKEEPVWSNEDSQVTEEAKACPTAKHVFDVTSSWNAPHVAPSRKPSYHSKSQHSSVPVSLSETRLSSSGLQDCSNVIASKRDSHQMQDLGGSNMRPHHHLQYNEMHRHGRPTESPAMNDLHLGVLSVENPRGSLPLATTSTTFPRNIPADTQHLRYNTDNIRERSVSMDQERTLEFNQQFHSYHHLDSKSIPHNIETSERAISQLPIHPSMSSHSARRMPYPADGRYLDSTYSSFDISQTASSSSERRQLESVPQVYAPQSQSETSERHMPQRKTDTPEKEISPAAQKDNQSDCHNSRHILEAQPHDHKKSKKISHRELIDLIVEASKHLEPIATPAKQKGGYLHDGMTENEVWDTMMMQFAHSAHATVKFAKKVPGFRNIPMQQQIGKVQSAMYQIVLVMLSTKYDLENEDYLYFCFSHKEEDLIMEKFPQFKPLPQHFINLGKSIAKLQPDKVEVAILCALCLFMGDDATDTSDESPEKVMSMHLLDGLAQYCEEKFKFKSNRYGHVLSQLTMLQNANSEHLNCVMQVKMSMPDLEIPQLYEETFLSI